MGGGDKKKEKAYNIITDVTTLWMKKEGHDIIHCIYFAQTVTLHSFIKIFFERFFIFFAQPADYHTAQL